MEVLTNIPVKLDAEDVLKRLNLRRKSEDMEKNIQELIEKVRPIARPKVIYEVAYVDNRNKNSLDIGGVRFISRLLRINLDEVGRVFPFVATCGTELEEIHVPSTEFVKSYCLDQIKEMVLESAFYYLEDYLIRRYELGQISEMEPGSLESWPITQQKELFSIFGNVEDLIGVRLTERFLMVPLKSVSGIYFPTEIKFESCQLCPRERCSGRRAPYDSDLARKYSEEI